VLIEWNAAEARLSVESENENCRPGVERALRLLSLLVPGSADVVTLDEAGHTWRYLLCDGDVRARSGALAFDGALTTLGPTLLARCSHCDQPRLTAGKSSRSGNYFVLTRPPTSS
jgi:hypothetical protein